MADIPVSFNGVSFSEEQKAILIKDLGILDQLNDDLKTLEERHSNGSVNIIDLEGRKDTDCRKLYNQSIPAWIQCKQDIDRVINQIKQDQVLTLSNIEIKKGQIKIAIKNYNDDLQAIQDQIKLQIQAQLANGSAATQVAQNTVTLNQNDPRILLIKAQAEAKAKEKALDLQATLDKQKRDSDFKMLIGVTFGLAILAFGFLIIRRIF